MSNPRTQRAARLAREYVQKYANRGDSFFARLLRNPRAMEEFVKAISGFFTTRPLSDRELEQAAATLREAMHEARTNRAREVDMELLNRANLSRRMQDDPGGLPETEQEVFAMNSSNVYSFAYTPESRTMGILYVTYRHGKPVGYKTQVNKTTGKKYRCAVKPFARGPMYAYFDVQRAIYIRLKQAQSKGEQIWDDLRIRGSVYGHQYRYTLVAGAKIGPSFDDVYVPRRATQSGFSKRAVRLTGTKGFVASTLSPERRRFRGADNDVYATATKRFRGTQ